MGSKKKLDFYQRVDNTSAKENAMNVFDIIGPVMIGPSSSHTAGAVRLGRVEDLPGLGEGLPSPALLVVGKVVGLYGELLPKDHGL